MLLKKAMQHTEKRRQLCKKDCLCDHLQLLLSVSLLETEVMHQRPLFLRAQVLWSVVQWNHHLRQHVVACRLATARHARQDDSLFAFQCMVQLKDLETGYGMSVIRKMMIHVYYLRYWIPTYRHINRHTKYFVNFATSSRQWMGVVSEYHQPLLSPLADKGRHHLQIISQSPHLINKDQWHIYTSTITWQRSVVFWDYQPSM